MKTTKQIYNYVKKQIEHLKNKILGLNRYDDFCKMSNQLDAYEDVLNYIGTVRSNENESNRIKN